MSSECSTLYFRIVDVRTERQVGSISKKWSGVLKEVLSKADRFSVDFPPDIGETYSSLYIRLLNISLSSDVGLKATLLGKISKSE